MRELLYDKVSLILTECKEARRSDERLFAEMLRRYASMPQDVLDTLVREFSAWESFRFDSIRRCRQRIQEKNPELRPPEKTQALRDKRKEKIISELYPGERL